MEKQIKKHLCRIIDEIPKPGHPSGNQHTAGTPNRHPATSIFNSEEGVKEKG